MVKIRDLKKLLKKYYREPRWVHSKVFKKASFSIYRGEIGELKGVRFISSSYHE